MPMFSEWWQARLVRIRRWMAYSIPVAAAVASGALTRDQPTRWLSPVVSAAAGFCAAVAVAEVRVRRRAARRTRITSQPALRRVTEIALVSFGCPDAGTGRDVNVLDPTGGGAAPVTEPFVPIDRYAPGDITAAGTTTPMIPGLQLALEIINS